MDEMNKEQIEQLLQSAPGGLAKLAFDDMLTILYATDTFYSLIKSVSDKIITKVPQALLRIVYSADIIHVTQQLAAQKHRKDNMISVNFRTLQQDGSFKWVMLTGNKIDETYQSGNKTVPVYSCIAIDITYLMLDYKKLEQQNDYHRAITELSKDLFFEYDIASDTLAFSELFREVFGKDAVLPNFRKRLDKTKMVHSDELPAVVAIYNSMMSGRKLARFEVTLISKDGTPLGYICYASIIFDENRNPYKVVGKLAIKNILSKEPDKPEYIPQRDSLTEVCTKESAEFLINEAMEKQSADSMSALFLIDIKNYKDINEIRRSIQGENILKTVADLMKTQFRSTDVIGRVGLSEFVVYMKDILSDQAVYEKADQLCELVEGIYSYGHFKNGLGVNIGIALQKGAKDYQTLLANANTALVMAKKQPGNSFEAFSQTVKM